MLCARSCAGVVDHIVFVFDAMQPLPAIKPCNIMEASENKLRLSKLSLMKPNDLGLCAKNPSQKCASHAPSVVKFIRAQYLFLPAVVVGVCSVVAVSPSLVCSYTVFGGCMKNLNESIRR